MAGQGGRGPAPTDPARRARGNREPGPLTVVRIERVEPLRDLPADLLADGEVWHPATLRWWRTWCDSPLAKNLLEVDWRELEVTALLHHDYMQGCRSMAPELRLRMAKWGATPEDRARLRIQVAMADECEASAGPTPPAVSARERYGDLRALPAPAKRAAPAKRTAAAKQTPAAKRAAPARAG
jgi:hypothetical protein